jgi:hypothetical protein
MRRAIVASLLTGLMILTGIVFAFSGKVRPSIPSMNEVLEAHHVPQTPDALAVYLAQAIRLTHYQVPPAIDSQGYFERTIRIAVDNDAFRRDTLDARGLRRQIDLFDGQTVYRAQLQRDRLIGSVGPLDESESRAVQSAVRLFGIMPVLKQLQVAGDQTVDLGVTEDGQEKFAIQTGSGEWTVYVDKEHLVRRLQMVRNQHHVTIDYSDYREIDGVRLAFVERVSADGSLLYELFFDRIDLSPTFPAGFFSREGLVQETIR